LGVDNYAVLLTVSLRQHGFLRVVNAWRLFL